MEDVDGQAGSAWGPTDQPPDDVLAEMVKATLRRVRVPNGYRDREELLEDLLFDAIDRVKQNLWKYDPGLKTPREHFIFGIVRTFVREAGNKKRKQQFREHGVSMQALENHIPPDIEFETPKLDKLTVDLAWIYEVVDLIATPRECQIAELRKKDYSFKEIANQLNMKENAACKIMSRLRKKVVEWFADELKAPRESVERWIDRLCGSLDYDPLEKQGRSSP